MSQEILQTHMGDTVDNPYKGTVQYQRPPGPQYDNRRRKKRQQQG